MLIIADNDITVHLLEDADYPLLAKWLSDQAVLEFYEGRDNPHNLARVTEVFGIKRDHSVTPCTVSHGAVKIGYIQYYPVSSQEKHEYGLCEASTVYGMDQFIGEPAYWNRGIGTRLVTAMVRFLTEQFEPDQIVMDPQTWNKRAIRCYEKAGFQKQKLLPCHELHEGEWRDCWLMSRNTQSCYTAL